MITLDVLLPHLKNVKRNGAGHLALCPVHDDHNPSLSITSKGGKLLVHCHGCQADLPAVLKALNLDSPNGNASGDQYYGQPFRATYDYTDERGILRYQVVRVGAGKTKEFPARQPDGRGGWQWGLKGVEKIPYQLQRLTETEINATVYITEGEKDADSIRKLGGVATCNPGGAGKWIKAFNKHLVERHVVITEDNDEAGRKHVKKIADSLRGIAASIKILRFPELPEGNDVSDWLATGKTFADLEQRVAEAPYYNGSDGPKDSKGNDILTPAKWFADRYPSLTERHGEAVDMGESEKTGICFVRDLNEDFFAATLGRQGTPDAPIVWIRNENRFWGYSKSEGIYVEQDEDVLKTRFSDLFLECARACQGPHVDTASLQFGHRDASRQKGIFEKARGWLNQEPEYFSSNIKEWLPCANGMLNLRTRKLESFNPNFPVRRKLGVPYDPDAKCNRLFLDTLQRQSLDEDDIDLLQRIAAQALTGKNISQTIAMATGTAGGGKTVTLNVLRDLIGKDNVGMLRTNVLADRFEIGRYINRSLLAGSDVHENFLNQKGASMLKSLTGGDPLTCEFKGSNVVGVIRGEFNIYLTCNSRLKVHLEGDGEAWRRRLRMLSYNYPKPKNPIPDLDKLIIQTEGPGVLNWALEGFYQNEDDNWRMSITQAQQDRVDNLLMESESHVLFAREMLVRAKDSLTIDAAHKGYVEYCNKRQWSAIGRNLFGTLIADTVAREYSLTVSHDVPDENTGKDRRGWHGLTLKPLGSTYEIASAPSDSIDTGLFVPDSDEDADAADAISQVPSANSNECQNCDAKNFFYSGPFPVKATWHNSIGDQPVVITSLRGYHGETPFYSADDTQTGIPGNELTFESVEDSDTTPSYQPAFSDAERKTQWENWKPPSYLKV